MAWCLQRNCNFVSISVLICALSCFPLSTVAAAASDSSDYKSMVRQSWDLIKIGSNTTALLTLNKAIKLNPQLPEAYMARAFLYRSMGQFDKAALEADKVWSIGIPERGFARFTGLIYERQGQYKKALGILNSRITEHTNWIYRSARARCFYELGNYEKAIVDLSDVLADVLEMYPTLTRVELPLRASCYAMIGNPGKCMKDLEEAIGLVAISGEHLYNPKTIGADSCIEAYQNILSDCQRRIAQAPGSPHAYFACAVCLYIMGKYKDALRNCNTAIGLDPHFTDAFLLAGHSQYMLGERDKASNYLERAITLSPRYETAYLAISNCFLGAGKIEKAVEYFSQKIKANPGNPSIFKGRAHVYSELGDQQKAIDDLSRAIELDQKDPATYLTRGELYQGLERRTEAIADFTKVVLLKADNNILRAAYKDRAACYMEQCEYNRAIADLNQIVSKVHSSRPLEARAFCYEKLGLLDQARKDKDTAKSYTAEPEYD